MYTYESDHVIMCDPWGLFCGVFCFVTEDQRTEVARRSKASASEMRDELDGVKEAMFEEKKSKLDITAGEW